LSSPEHLIKNLIDGLSLQTCPRKNGDESSSQLSGHAGFS